MTDSTGTIIAQTESTVIDDVERILTLLCENAWAEHCTETAIGRRLEVEITRLIACTGRAR